MKKIFFLQVLVLSYILIDNCQAQALVRYAKQGNVDKVKELLDRGVDTTAMNDALYEAADRNYIDIITILIEKGANINSVHQVPTFRALTFTPVGRAAWKGKTDAVRILVENGADVNKGSLRPLNAIACLWYSHTTNTEIVKLLLEGGADPNYYNKELPSMAGIGKDRSPLFYVAGKTADSEILKLLIEFGADINQKDSYGNTALIYALDKATYWGVNSPGFSDIIYGAKLLFSKSIEFQEGKAIIFCQEHLSLSGPDILNIEKSRRFAYLNPGDYNLGVGYSESSSISSMYGTTRTTYSGGTDLNLVAEGGFAYLILFDQPSGRLSLQTVKVDCH
jgi:hypothetical protein